MSRIAKLVGIDAYATAPLTGCVADVTAISQKLRRNDDGTKNFDCQTLTEKEVTRAGLRKAISDVFDVQDAEIALFYFAGHGLLKGDAPNAEGILRTIDGETDDEGVPMEWVLAKANNSGATERIIILDCCHAGVISQILATASPAPLKEGVSILAASRNNQLAAEFGGRGAFSSLLESALGGGAADVRGHVTTSSVYTYVDQLLTPWKQRPLFRTSVAGMTPIRRAAHSVSDPMLRELGTLFPADDTLYQLDKSYEPREEPSHPEHERIFGVLQTCRAAGLIEVVGAQHMYDAAIGNKHCRLTALGRGYWHQVKRDLF